MSILKRLDGDHIIQGALTVLGGINDPTISQVKTRLATTEDDVRVAQGEIAELPTVAEVEGMIDAQVPELVIIHTPKNLGRFYASHPTSFFNMDRWVVYDEDDDPIQRGVYYSDNGTPTRITTASAQALQLYIAEGMQHIAWAEAQGTYGTSADYGIESVFQSLGAVSAFIETLAAKQAFIESLFANQIEVPDDGRIRYYTGQGVQRRAVELANESVSWIDTPDTTPATDEQLRARIGRLGVGDTVLMGGEFYANIDTPWSSESTVNASANVRKTASVVGMDGARRIAYVAYADSKIYEIVNSGSGWDSPTLIVDASCSSVCYLRDANGIIHICYTTAGIVYWKLLTGSAWGAPSYITDGLGAALGQIGNGDIRCAYFDNTVAIYEKLFNGTSWGSATLIKSAQSGSGWLTYSPDGKHLAYQRGSDYYLVEKVNVNGVWDSGETLISTTPINGSPSYYEEVTGLLHITFSRSSDYYLVECVIANGVWGSEKVINAQFSYMPSAYQNQDGSIWIAYCKASSPYLVERTLQRYARLGAGIIESGTDADGYYVKFSDGTLMQYTKGNIAMSGTAANAQRTLTWVFPVPFKDADSYAPSIYFMENTSGLGSFNSFLTDCSSASQVVFSMYATSTGVSYCRCQAIGRWK